MNKIGKRIKEARKINNLTQTKLAKKCNMHQIEISRYETGMIKPSLGSLIKISKALKIELEYFI